MAKGKCGFCNFLICGWILFFVGLLGVMLATWLPPFINQMIDSGIDDQIVITEKSQRDNTDAYKSWVDSKDKNAFPADFLVYMFNITNPLEILQGAKPNLTEVGPYHYKQHYKRFNITFPEDEFGRSLVRYRQWNYWLFDREATPSHLSESDVFTSVNGPFLEIGAAFAGVNPELVKLYGNMSDEQRLFYTGSMNSIMWGYIDQQLLEVANQLGNNDTISAFYPGAAGPNITSQDDCYSKKWVFPSQCFFDTRFTGDHEPGLTQSYFEWQELDEIRVYADPHQPTNLTLMWNTSEASAIWGTDGNSFHKYIDEDEILVAWIPSLFRKIGLSNPTHDSYTKQGIKLLKFSVAESGFWNYTANPFNAPYFQNVSGILDVADGWSQTPVVMSRPHFLDADPTIQEMYNGLNPTFDLHTTYIGVEPTTGITMDAHSRIQANQKIFPIHVETTVPKYNQTWFANITTGLNGLLLPIFWVDYGGTIPSNLATTFKDSIYVGQAMSYYTMYVGNILGALFMAAGISMVHLHFFRQGKTGDYSDPLINRD
jgi:lysosome membrane protein 2